MADPGTGIAKRLVCVLLIVANGGATAGVSMATLSSVNNTVNIEVGSGSFVLEGGTGRENRSINIHYHRPVNLTRSSPVMVVIPGAGRNGDDYRDAWVDASEQYGVLILSPSYSEIHCPEFWSYNLANMPDSVTVDIRMQVDTNPEQWQFSDEVQRDADLERLAQRSPLLRQFALLALSDMIADVDAEATGLIVNQDRSAWIYSDFDRLFETAQHALDLEAETYDLFGHSAGGQVLHRFVLFHPENRANRILAANAGWYTLPDFETAFPYGLGNTGMEADEIRRAFQSRLVVFLGEKDDEHETRGSLRNTPEATRQGPGRLQRGKFFFTRARAMAKQLDSALVWKLEVVPGVGHEYRRMAAAAGEYLYDREP